MSGDKARAPRGPGRRHRVQLDHILDFLDDLDAAPAGCAVSSANGADGGGVPLTMSALQHHERSMVGSVAESDVSTEAESVFTGVKAKIDRLQAESVEKDAIIEKMRRTLVEQREREQQRVKEVTQNAEDHLCLQKSDLENVIKRNVTLINQLIADKEALTTKYQDASKQCVDLEAKLERDLSKSNSEHLKQVATIKNQLTVSEKKKREAWVAAETKKIKAAAVKALEPDIAALLSKHKAEIRRLDEEHAAELRRRDAMLQDKERDVLQASARSASDAEAAFLEVRETFKKRLEEQTERLEQRLDETRSVHKRERDALLRAAEEERETFRKKLSEVEDDLRAAQKREEAAARSLREAKDTFSHEAKLQRDREIEDVRRQLEANKEREVEMLRLQMKQEQDAVLRQREQALADKLAAEQAEKFEAVVARLEEEAMKVQRENNADRKVLMEKLAKAEHRSLAEESRAGALEEEVKQVRVLLKEKDRDLTAEMLRGQRERERVAEERGRHEEEFAARLAHAETLLAAQHQTRIAQAEAAKVDAVRELEAAQQALKAYTRQADDQHDALQEKHSEELEAVQQRVLAIVRKKDNEINALKCTIHKLEMQIKQTDMVLERNRELICP